MNFAWNSKITQDSKIFWLTLLTLFFVHQPQLSVAMTPQQAENVFAEAVDLYEKNEYRLRQMEMDTKITETHTENEAKILKEKKEQQEQLIRLEFQRIAAMYQGIIDSGIESGQIFYNQGNAWLCGGEPSQALAAYRQAEKYMPLNPYLQSNIQLVSQAESPMKRVPFGHSFVFYLFFWQNTVSYPTKLKVAVSLVVVMLIIGVLYQLKDTTQIKDTTTPLKAITPLKDAVYFVCRIILRPVIVSVLLAVTTLAVFSAYIDWCRFEQTQYGVVNTENVIVRKGNSADYEPAFDEPLKQCTEFIIRDQRGDWLLIELANGNRGWITKLNHVHSQTLYK